MSEVSRSAPTAPKAVTPANRPAHNNASEERGDAFSALLSLAADTQAAPSAPADEATDEPTNEPGEAKAKNNEDNPVTQVLGWADTRSGGRASSAAAPATAAAGTPASPVGTSDAASASKASGVDISGMSALAKPEAVDPAALPPGAIAARSAATTAKPTDARATGARIEAKKAVVGNEAIAALHASAAAGSPLQGVAIRAGLPGGAVDAARGRSTAWAASTVSMDLSMVREVDDVAGTAVSLTARLSELLTGRAPADGAAPSPLLGDTQEAGGAAAEAPSLADLLPTPEAPADAESAQLNHWSTQQLRHAHLRLGDGGLDSLDIRLSMQGQDLSVDFRSDNADIRQSLAQQASQSLTALLERSGIALADVSVGSQQQRQPGGQSGGQQQATPTALSGRGAIGRADAADASAGPMAPAAVRPDGSRPLDLFV